MKRMKNMAYVLLIAMFWAKGVTAQGNKPAVVVGIVVDQMRADYLEVFEKHFGNGGFNRLKQNGLWFKNCYINYIPSYTAPGHASIYTGSTPAIHGIVGNNWYDARQGTMAYCVGDEGFAAVGGAAGSGRMSPRSLLVTTFSDELRLATNQQARSFAVSLKDRGAILPGGYLANAAYWMDDSLANFMSSTYYMSDLPAWVRAFNECGKVEAYLKGGWQTKKALTDYIYHAQDNSPYEAPFADQRVCYFPYTFQQQKQSIIKKTPFGNSIVFDFAKELIRNEKVGRGASTDFLAISFSATDYIGHHFGPNSVEVEDTYLRLDEELAVFIDFLDETYGKRNYVLFLTADHGAAHNPQYLLDKKVPAGYFFADNELIQLNNKLEEQFGEKDACKSIINGQVYLNLQPFAKDKQQAISDYVVHYFQQHEAVQSAFEMHNISNLSIPPFLKDVLLLSYLPARSGQIGFVLKPAYLDAYATTGTSHGVWNPYDTKIPLLFYGNGIPGKTKNEKVFITDIAPTLANYLGISPPNGCIGQALQLKP